ncbi:MAG: S8 family serine peptidase, partial [Chloroflexi bacterium]|nr:S8 family serine peptidase [Chloroflexota bacterium]
VEFFSSDGPRRIFFNSAGGLLPGAPPGNFSASGGVVRQKPDIAAADGVSTATPGFNPFYGTSAAAPHAAAIAALVRQAFPAFTPAQIRAALTGSALDIEAPGIDRDSGAGIVMAYETLSDNGAQSAARLEVSNVATTPTAGDGDPFPEPGDAFNMAVSLRNQGGAGATAISATLSTTTPGVTITQATSTYPDLVPAAVAANSTPFAFSLSPSLPCGTAVEFRLTVAYSGGFSSPALLDFTVDTGQPGSPVTFSYSGPVVPIPDGIGPEFPGPPASVPLAVSGLSGPLADVKLRIDGSACTTNPGAATVGVDHTFVEDLHFELRSPSGTTTALISRTGEDGNNFCQTLLDDASLGPPIQGLPASSAPFTGSFLPATPLAGFHGESGNGTWRLLVTDHFETDTGSVRAFSLIATARVCTSQASLSVGDATVTEGDSGTQNATFNVTLSATSSQTVTVKYATANGTATAGSDYSSVPLTTLTFSPGQTTKLVSVAVSGDTLDEPDETFFVNLSAPTNATLGDGQGVGTILDNDPAPQLAIGDASVLEGAPAAFSVTLTPASGRVVTVAYTTSNGTAVAGSDYAAAAGSLSFAPGETSKTITIATTGDTAVEPDESFSVSLSGATNATISDAVAVGTIRNDDVAALSI